MRGNTVSKKFFRFLRGELNGYYISNVYMALNRVNDYVEEFVNHFARMTFKPTDLVSGDEFPIMSSVLGDIGAIAGVFKPNVYQDSMVGALRFTQSHKVNGVEYSERGLLNVESAEFNFVRANQAEYDSDINVLATEEDRSSLVEKEAEVLGYIYEGDKVWNTDGTINYAMIHSTPPDPSENKAYIPFYGERYLFLSEESPIIASTPDYMYYELIKAMQWVRYNGCSIYSLVKFAEVVCPGFLKILSIDWDTLYAEGIINYGVDYDIEVSDRLLRTNIFKMVIAEKFPQFTFVEKSITVERDEYGFTRSVTLL